MLNSFLCKTRQTLVRTVHRYRQGGQRLSFSSSSSLQAPTWQAIGGFWTGGQVSSSSSSSYRRFVLSRLPPSPLFSPVISLFHSQQAVDYQRHTVELRPVLRQLLVRVHVDRQRWTASDKDVVERFMYRYDNMGRALRGEMITDGYWDKEDLACGTDDDGEEDARWENVWKDVDAMRTALTKLPVVPRGTVVYRGTDLPLKVARQIKPGATFCEPSFGSSSQDPNRADVTEGCFLFEIESKTGVDVHAVSLFPHEWEVLFRPGTWFRIIRVEEIVRVPRGSGGRRIPVTRVRMVEM